jgi:predicted nucleic acid-binding protein
LSRSTLAKAIPAGQRLVLDTSVVLAYLNAKEAASPIAAIVLDDFVRSGRNTAAISTVTVTETLVRPFKAGDVERQTAEAFLLHYPNLEIREVDYETAREAARLRAETGLKTPDALVVATASAALIPVLVANDDKWAKAIAAAVPRLTLCHLEGHAPA